MEIKNYTPHVINIIDRSSTAYDNKQRKYVLIDDNPIITHTIKSSGMLNVKYDLVGNSPIDNIPVVIKKRVSIDPIPEGVDVAIVSGLYASATDDPRAYSIIDPVFHDNKIIGCLAIGKVEN